MRFKILKQIKPNKKTIERIWKRVYLVIKGKDMEKEEELKMKLSIVQNEFKKENYEKALLKLEEAGKIIVVALNAYNSKR